MTASGKFVFRLVTVTGHDDGTVSEVTRRVSADGYNRIASSSRDPSRSTVVQRRISFLYKRQAFELQTDVAPFAGVSVLYRQAAEVRVGD